MSRTISVALCVDRNIEVGLHVTLYSLLESSKCPIKIYLIQKGYSLKNIEDIHKTLTPFHGSYELNVIQINDLDCFNKYRGLHGNKFAFVRIMLASILPDQRVIYLDSDLAVKKDLSSLYYEDLHSHVIGVSGIGNIEYSLESSFFTSIGLEKYAKYFNTGVMLIDLDKWRQLNVTKKCFEFADRYPNMLLTADQTILNYVFYENNFHELDKSYNHALYPNSQQITIDQEDSIFHFVGSPKPWDFLGELVHRNYPLFHSILCKTKFKNYKTFLDLSFQRAKRTLKLSRSYYLCLKNRSN